MRVQVRLQLQTSTHGTTPRYQGMFSTLATIARQEHWTAVFKVRSLPSTALPRARIMRFLSLSV